MRALVWHGERRIALEEVEEPAPAGADEVVLEVEIAGICGSDIHPYRGHAGPRVPPLVLGHEVVGAADGSRYALYPLIGCGSCDRCSAGEDNLCSAWQLVGMHRAGAFADRVLVPRRSLVPIPDTLESARATLAEPLACCVGALRPHAVGEGVRVLVLGCGAIGLLTVFAAARAGAAVTAVDPLPGRRAHAERLGASRTASGPAEAGAVGQDVVVDAAGYESTWRAGIEAARNGGAVVVLGLGQAEGAVPMALVVRKAVTLRGQFGYSRADFDDAVAILTAGDLDLGWIAEMPLAAGAEAFARLVDCPGEFTKVLLRP